MKKEHLAQLSADRIREKLTSLAEIGAIPEKDFYKETDEAIKEQWWFLMESALEINLRQQKKNKDEH